VGSRCAWAGSGDSLPSGTVADVSVSLSVCAALVSLTTVDLQSKITPSNGKKVTGKDFNAYLAANKVRGHTPQTPQSR
jgi:hypothetical protein